ncbi:VOC family protein [Propylenella binzhouense]|uniref:VOC family protein n=1 Tax=Propylenella binzhouense TaxID=2555902 RepID=A0A964WVC6_9HYPH|nr:VOC family protein [Propylenella binzhouense]MYZ50092.1 VOC family protein [Propylenella binzhouense]
MHGIDHLVLPVATLAGARARLAALGFTVAPEARHPFGTGNCCVFFENRTYLEPVSVVDRESTEAAIAGRLFFVERVAGFAKRCGEGFAMLATRSVDAAADAARFAAAGIGVEPLFRFSRKAEQPDGSEREIGVVLAFAADPRAVDAAFFACQHLSADALWRPDYLAHPNGARGIVSAAAVAESPADFHILLEAATGCRELRVTSFEVEADLGGARVTIFTPIGYRARYGVEPPDPGRGLRLAAFEVEVSDLAGAARFAPPGSLRREEMIVVPAAPGLGAALAFRAGTDD